MACYRTDQIERRVRGRERDRNKNIRKKSKRRKFSTSLVLEGDLMTISDSEFPFSKNCSRGDILDYSYSSLQLER